MITSLSIITGVVFLYFAAYAIGRAERLVRAHAPERRNLS